MREIPFWQRLGTRLTLLILGVAAVLALATGILLVRGFDLVVQDAMATAGGARALGLADRVGDVREGRSAEMCLVGPLPETDEPLRAVLAGEGDLVRVLGR